MISQSSEDDTLEFGENYLSGLASSLTEEQAMRLEMHMAWLEASTVFDSGTLYLSGAELMKARDKARPFVKVVSREFRRHLGGRVLFEKELTHRVELQLLGWGEPLTLKYPASRPTAMSTLRHRYDQFEMALPTGSLRLSLRFRLGEGEKADNTWNMVEWGLGTWGARPRVETEAIPVLRQIQQRLADPELHLDYWEGIVAPIGTWAQLGRIVGHAEFDEDIDRSVETVASDLHRLLEAAEPYQK
jgi:hypothetical protein